MSAPKYPHRFIVLSLYMICAVALRVVAQVIVMSSLESIKTTVNIEIVSDIIASVIVLPLLILIFHKTNILTQNVINKKKMDVKIFFLGVVSIWMSSIVGSSLWSLSSHVLSCDIPNENSQTLLTWMDGYGWVTLVLMYVSTSLCAPIVEEFIFRGIIFKCFRVRFSFWISACVSAILFAALHMDAYAAVGTFLMGIVFALLYETSGNLILNVMVHCAYNSFVFYVLASMDVVAESESSVLADFFMLFISCGMLILSCRAIYRRKSKNVK